MTHVGAVGAIAAGTSLTERERVERWRAVYDSIYAAASADPDPTFNVAGWRSRYDRKPFPAPAMHAWLEDTLERLLAEAPRHVWELGCGTGLILFRLAPHCESYYATDISPAALRYVNATLQGSASIPASRVCLLEAPADQLPDPALRFDTVILNSVVQHFPGIEYLDRVLQGILQRVSPGGRVYIGDVRDLALLPALHADIEARRAPSHLSAEELSVRIQRAIDLESELVLAREYFLRLPERFPAVKHVEIQLKRGDFPAELAQFRYEAILHCGARPLVPDAARLPWSPELNESRVWELLSRDRPGLLHLAGIPNARLARPLGPSAARPYPDLGLDPAALVRIGSERDYRTELHACCDGDAGKFEALWRAPPHIRGAPRALPPPGSAVPTTIPLANSPAAWHSPALADPGLGRR